MKRVIYIFSVIFFMLFAYNYLYSQIDSSLKLLYPHDPDQHSFNPDSVMIDTCATTDPTFPVLYAYKWYNVFLPSGSLIIPCAPRDSIVYREWSDIDTNFIELREGFQMIENKFGPFILKKQYPDDTDSSHLGSRSCYIKFEKYFNIDTVTYYLNNELI